MNETIQRFEAPDQESKQSSWMRLGEAAKAALEGLPAPDISDLVTQTDLAPVATLIEKMRSGPGSDGLARTVLTESAAIGKSGASLSAALENVMMEACSLAVNASDASEAVSSLRGEIESLVESSQGVITRADEVQNQARSAVSQSENGEQALDLLEASSNKISDFVAAINNISSKTNLLALNARIEAARSGKHGLGFEVVASEVKRLAEQTSDLSKEVEAQLEELASLTGNLRDAFGGIVGEIQAADASLHSLVDEQKVFANSTGSRLDEISQAYEMMSNIMSGLSSMQMTVVETGEAYTELTSSVDRLSSAADGSSKPQ